MGIGNEFELLGRRRQIKKHQKKVAHLFTMLLLLLSSILNPHNKIKDHQQKQTSF
jgi:hypothetical protein